MKMKSLKINCKFSNRDIYILIYVVLFLVHYFTDFSFTITYAAWILFGLLGIIVLKKPLQRNLSKVFVLLILDIIAFVNLFISGNHSAFNALMLPVLQLFGMYLFYYKHELGKLVHFLYGVMIYMFIYILVAPKTLVSAWSNDWYTYFSKLMGGNTISIFLILFLCIDIFYRNANDLKINYVPFLASLIMAYIGGGTGGVLSITVLLIGVISLKWKSDKISKCKVITVIIVGVIGITLIDKWEYLFIKLTDDNSRFWIWSNYYECATSSVKDFLCGGYVEHIPFLADQRNMHSTFLNWHYYYGLLPFISMTSASIYLLISSLWQKKYILFIVLTTLFLRAFTDETTFCFMPIWIFSFFELRRIKKRKNT